MKMPWWRWLLAAAGLLMALVVGRVSKDPTGTLKERRAGFSSALRPVARDDAEAPREPPGDPRPVFERVKYPSSIGPLWAYVTPAPRTPGRHPAMVWAVGGFSGSMDPGIAEAGPPANDQTASAFREAGVVLMLPTLRGGNDNPGRHELLLGEVDDFLAAAAFVKTLPYVDPDRVYLGGHSTGGTLVLLAAELSDAFRAAFAFGPVHTPEAYGPEYAPFDPTGPRADQEWLVRSPWPFLHDIRRPTFVLEGAGGNADAARFLAERGAPNVHVHVTTWGDHFSVLQPLSRRLAAKILADATPGAGIVLTAADLAPPP